MTDDDHRHTGEGIAHAVKATAVQAVLVPDGRHVQAQVHIVGQQRHACGGTAAVDDPVVAAPIEVGVAQDSGQSVESVKARAAQPGVAARFGGDDDGRAVGVGGQELLSSLFAQLGDDAGAQQLVAVIAAQVIAHHLAPGQRVNRRPGGGVHAQDGEFQRQTIAVGFDVGVHPFGVGFHDGAHVVVHQCPVFLGRPAQAQGAQKEIGVQGGLA